MANKVRIQTATRPAEGAIQAVYHPYQLHGLYEDLLTIQGGSYGQTSANTGSMQDNILKNYEVFDLAGVRIWSDPLITIDGSDDAKGGVFAKGALIYVPYDEEEIETEYDSSLRGTEVNMVATYGYGEYEDTWGFENLFDAATPSS